MAATYVRQYGGVRVVLTGNDRGLQRMLVDEMFLPALLAHADTSEQKATALAKSYERAGRRGSSARRTGRRYSQSFDVEYGTGTTRDGRRRLFARLVNTNPFAFYIEYGNANLAARRIVRTATGITRFDAQGDIHG